MKHLTKVKLINWHTFENRTIPIDHNALISGDNGAGKSTFLDAIQYLLTGGKEKFNTAANIQDARTLEGYMRGKLGFEGKRFLRSGDVTTHVALELYDDLTQEKQILGAVLQLNAQATKANKTFYHIANCEMRDELFENDEYYFDIIEMTTNLRLQGIHCHTTRKQKEFKDMIKSCLSIENDKYFELLPKALAFKPINNLSEFVNDFLLKEDFVNVDGLRQNIRSLSELQVIIDKQLEKQAHLDRIIHTYQEYETMEKGRIVYTSIKGLIHMDELKNKRSKDRKQKEEYERLEEACTQRIKEIDQLLEHKRNLYHELQSSLNGNESYQYKNRLNKEITDYTSQKNELTGKLAFFQARVKEELVLHQRLSEKRLEQFMAKHQDYTSMILRPLLHEIENSFLLEKERLNDVRHDLNRKKSSLQEEQRKHQEKLHHLLENRFSYSDSLMNLQNEIRTGIMAKHQVEIEVKPLCEYLEVKDPQWRNALEGFLNTQRFDLIIEPQYFDEALRIYERKKKEYKIANIGLVNTGKLDLERTPQEDSLALRLIFHNQYAKAYVVQLMGSVICVPHVDDLKRHRMAITETCMVYRNHTARQIAERVYQTPYLGQEALRLQLQATQRELEDINEQLIQNDQALQKIVQKLNDYGNSKLQSLIQICQVVDSYKNIEEQLAALQETYAAIKKDDSWIALDEESQKLSNEISQLDMQSTSLKRDQGSYQAKRENLTHALKEQADVIDAHTQLMTAMKEENIQVYQEIEAVYEEMKQRLASAQRASECDKKIAAYEKRLQQMETDLILEMKEFNQIYAFAAAPQISSMQEYRDELYKVKNRELIEYREHVKEIKVKSEQSFRDEFIAVLREKIRATQQDLDELNKALKSKRFGDERFEFKYSASKNQIFHDYYDLIMKQDEHAFANTLFEEQLDEKDSALIQELFARLTANLKDSSMNEKVLREYTDYRNYMSYDIKITNSRNESYYFSKVNKEKSGGETQTPFYVVIAASFEQLLKNQDHQMSKGCIVMFDEAFNNMDESRIDAMMKFYNNLNIQLLIAVPPQRMDTIVPYVNSTLLVTKYHDASYIETFYDRSDKMVEG